MGHVQKKYKKIIIFYFFFSMKEFFLLGVGFLPGIGGVSVRGFFVLGDFVQRGFCHGPF